MDKADSVRHHSRERSQPLNDHWIMTKNDFRPAPLKPSAEIFNVPVLSLYDKRLRAVSRGRLQLLPGEGGTPLMIHPRILVKMYHKTDALVAALPHLAHRKPH